MLCDGIFFCGMTLSVSRIFLRYMSEDDMMKASAFPVIIIFNVALLHIVLFSFPMIVNQKSLSCNNQKRIWSRILIVSNQSWNRSHILPNKSVLSSKEGRFFSYANKTQRYIYKTYYSVSRCSFWKKEQQNISA